MYALKAIIMLKEIIMVQTEAVTVSPRASAEPQKTGSTNSGAKQPDASASKQSILKQAASQLGL